MNNQEMKDVAVASAPLMGTPLAPLVAIGGIGALIYWAFKSDKKEEAEQLATAKSTAGDGWWPFTETVEPTVQTVKPTVQETVGEPLNEPQETVKESPMYTYKEDSTAEIDEFDESEEELIEESEPKPTEEQIKKELVRQAMSELGKRSAEKRRRKKLD